MIRSGDFQRVDIDNIAEEIESLGRSQRAALRSSYRLVAMRLLKFMHQPGMASAGWENTINRERGDVEDLLDDNPGLKPKRAALFVKAYASARSDVAFETRLNLDVFPAVPAFSIDQLEDKAFWPAGFPRNAERRVRKAKE